MYVNCHIQEISIKANKTLKPNEWEYHIALTQRPLYMIYRRDEIPCEKRCNECEKQGMLFEEWI